MEYINKIKLIVYKPIEQTYKSIEATANSIYDTTHLNVPISQIIDIYGLETRL